MRLSRFMVYCASYYKEASRMAPVQFMDVQDRPTEFLDLTSLTLDEFQQLVPPFETAFQAHMAAWRLDGKPRTARKMKPPRSKLRGITRKGIVCETPRFLTLFPLQGNLAASSEESPDSNGLLAPPPSPAGRPARGSSRVPRAPRPPRRSGPQPGGA